MHLKKTSTGHLAKVANGHLRKLGCPAEGTCPCPCPSDPWPPAWPCHGMTEEYHLHLKYRFRHWLNSIDCGQTGDPATSVDCNETIEATIRAYGPCAYTFAAEVKSVACPVADLVFQLDIRIVSLEPCLYGIQIGSTTGGVLHGTAEATRGELVGSYTPIPACVQTGWTESELFEIVEATIS